MCGARAPRWPRETCRRAGHQPPASPHIAAKLDILSSRAIMIASTALVEGPQQCGALFSAQAPLRNHPQDRGALLLDLCGPLGAVLALAARPVLASRLECFGERAADLAAHIRKLAPKLAAEAAQLAPKLAADATEFAPKLAADPAKLPALPAELAPQFGPVLSRYTRHPRCTASAQFEIAAGHQAQMACAGAIDQRQHIAAV